MYISIDHVKLRFLHKHPDFNTVCNLDFIAARPASVGPIDAMLYQEFTDAELTLLYRHTTNSDHIPYIGDNLRLVLIELAERFPVTDADALQVHQQAEYLEKRYPQGAPAHRYVRGAGLPACTDDLLFPDPIPLTVQDAANAVRKHGQRLQQRAAALAAAVTPPSPSTAPVPRAAAVATRPQKGVCAQIWLLLDQFRATHGEAPTRQQIKDIASANGWNPNTTSVQSAAWRRANNLA